VSDNDTSHFTDIAESLERKAEKMRRLPENSQGRFRRDVAR